MAIRNACIAITQALETAGLDQPRRRQLGVIARYRPGRKIGVLALERRGLGDWHDRVLEEAAGIADHRRIGELARAQAQHRLGDMERRRLRHAHRRELLAHAGVVEAQRARTRQGKHDRGDQPAVGRALEDRVAIGEAAGVVIERDRTLRWPVPGLDGMNELARLDSVGADILQRRGTDGAGDQDQVFQSGIAPAQRPAHEVIPAFAGGDADQHARVVVEHLDASRRHRDHGAGVIAGEQHVAALAQYQQVARTHGRVSEQLRQCTGVMHFRQQRRACRDAQRIARGQRRVLDQRVAAHGDALRCHAGAPACRGSPPRTRRSASGRGRSCRCRTAPVPRRPRSCPPRPRRA